MTSKAAKAVLRKAAKLLERRGAWTQGEAARDAEGFGVRAFDGDAVRWCAQGAIDRVAVGAEEFEEACERVESIVGGQLPGWNDAKGRTKRQVLAALRKAAR